MTTTKYSYGLFHTGHAAATKQTTTKKLKCRKRKRSPIFDMTCTRLPYDSNTPN